MKLVETSKGKLYIGSKDDALKLVQRKGGNSYDVIWNLASELAFLTADQCKYATTVLFADIPDYGVPTNKKVFKTQLKKVVKTLEDGGTVFIHCLGGHGRTGTALAAIKKYLDNFSNAQALAFAKDKCEGPESDIQTKFFLSL